MKNRPLNICGIDVQPGERVTLALPTPEIYTCAPLHIPMHVWHGKRQGPILLICATFHGDEINGIAILQRLLNMRLLKKLQGTLIAIPVMNVYGLINHTHSLPDGGDLEQNFPGSESGSFASRMAYLFSSEIFEHCTHCITIRTGGAHTYKVPHVIYPHDGKDSKHLAEVFDSPILSPSSEQETFFIHTEDKPRKPTLIFEGGEINRTDEFTIRTGVKGITKVMRELNMIKLKGVHKPRGGYAIVESSWIRASGSGLFYLTKKIGSFVKEKELLAIIVDPFGTSREYKVFAENSGIIIGVNTHPLVYEGQGIIELGQYESEPKTDTRLEVPLIQSNNLGYESMGEENL